MTVPSKFRRFRWRSTEGTRLGFVILGLLLTAANVASGLLAYFFQIVLGNLLTRPDYLIFSAVMGLVAFVSSPLHALFTKISQRVLLISISEGYREVRRYYFKVLLKSVVACGLGFLFWLPVIYRPSLFLSGGTSTLTKLLYLIVACSLFFSINNGFLQGTKNFKWLSVVHPLGVIFKIIIAIGFVWLGFGVNGALIGVALALLLSSAIGMWATLKSCRDEDELTEKLTPNLKSVGYSSILIANVAFAASTQLDIVFANNFLPQKEAELYAATAILGKAVLYVPTGLVLALFPLTLEREARLGKSFNPLFTAIAMAALLCGTIVAIFTFFGGFIVETLFANKFAGAESLLGLYAIAFIPFAFVYILEHVLIAQGRVIFAYIMMLVAPIQLALIISNQSLDAKTLVHFVGAGGFSMLLLGVAVACFKQKKALSSDIEKR